MNQRRATPDRRRKTTVRKPFHEILEVVRSLGSGVTAEGVVENTITRLCEKLGKRARCVLLEGDDLRVRFWAGEHSCPIGGLPVDRQSVVWDALRKGAVVNLTEPGQTEGFRHSLPRPIRIKAVIPLTYVDPLTEETKKLGALIVDSGEGAAPISDDDFEYLQVIGQLMSGVMGRAELVKQLMTSCLRQEEILMQTAHNFRNSIAVIGGFSQRISQLAGDTELAEKATHLHEEVKSLEAHLAEFEKYMSIKA